MENTWKTKIELPYDPAIPLLGIYLEKAEALINLKRYMHPNVHSSTIYNSQCMEATQVSMNRWMDKEDVVCVCACIYIYIYIYNEILLSHKKEWNSGSNVDGPREYYAWWNKSDKKDESYMISLTCRI